MRKGKYIRTLEFRKKQSDARKGKLVWNEGIPCSEETKLKISKSLTGKPSPKRGIKVSDESKLKMSIAKKGKHLSPSTEFKKGMHLSPKTEFKKGMPEEEHPSWLGGISFLPYCFKFNTELKEKIRSRDNHICQMPGCLCTQLESLSRYHKKLTVHHIHYDKENCDPDLISLCIACNSKVNSNRDYWEELFMNILRKRNIISGE